MSPRLALRRFEAHRQRATCGLQHAADLAREPRMSQAIVSKRYRSVSLRTGFVAGGAPARSRKSLSDNTLRAMPRGWSRGVSPALEGAASVADAASHSLRFSRHSRFAQPTMHTVSRPSVTTAALLVAALASAACSDFTNVTNAAPLAPTAPAAQRGAEGELSGGKSCGAFSIRLGDGTVLSGSQKRSLAGVTGPVTLNGRYARFVLDPATFTVTDYALNGTAIFARKQPLHGQTLTQALTVDLNNEQLVLTRATADGRLVMKIQAKDCSTGGVFQMEGERATPITYEHELAAGLSYFDPNPATSRTFFHDAGSLLGYDSPENATRTFPALGSPVSGQIARYVVQPGGRMGMVVGEDAQQGLATP
jgi:hypothetical protein